MNIRNWAASLVVTVALTLASSAHATLISYGFTVSGSWFDTGTPFGMPLSPSLAGTIEVDNTQVGAAALIDFSLTTGSHTWTQSEFVGSNSSFFSFDGGGNLLGFGLDSFESGLGHMYIYTNNTMAVFDGTEFNGCNDCVALGQGTPVPEPPTLALSSAGLLALGALRRRRKAKA